MAQTVTPSQIKFGYECYYRCDQCSRNVYENYQWLTPTFLVEQIKQDDGKCPYCRAEIDFDLSAIDKPTDITPAILRFPTKNYAFVLKTDQSILTTVTITVRGTAGKSFEINWGDRNKTIITLTGADQVNTHDYSKQDNYYIRIFCETNILKRLYIQNSKLCSYMPSTSTQISLTHLYFNFNTLSNSIPPLSNLTSVFNIYLSDNNLSGSIPSLSQLVQLSILNLNNNNLSGSIPSLSTNVNLMSLYVRLNNLSGSIPSLSNLSKIITIYFDNNNLSGSIPSLVNNVDLKIFTCWSNNITGSTPSLTANTKLQRFYIHLNQITNYTASTLALTLVFFYAQNNQLPSAAVNQILADFVTNLALRPGAGTIYLHGTGNQPPTGQGIIDKAAIIAHGWTVLTN